MSLAGEKRSRDLWESENEAKTSETVPNHVKEESNTVRKCPFLDTINRQMLDFDSEKLCSVTLTNRNIYVCLVCGKFYEGRGKSTPAYLHSVDQHHYVFMNLESGRSYCLPDNYEILDKSLEDIQRCISPKFSLQELQILEENTKLVTDVHGLTYLPGYIGLNNLNATDDVNVILHLLSHIIPFRNFFLQKELYQHCQNKLVQEFGLVSLF
jgi:U4/U6.U5 tri-snRNP-associated protein 2